MDKAVLMKVGRALRDAEMAVETMIFAVDPNTDDPDVEEFIQEMTQVEGALMEFDRYLSSFSLPKA